MLNESFINSRNEVRFKHVRLFSPELKRKHLTSAFIVCFISMMFCGISSMLMPVYLQPLVKNIVSNISTTETITAGIFINAVFIVGSLCGGVLINLLRKKTGSRKALILSTALYGLCTALTAFSFSWFTVIVCRFATGFGIGGVLLTANIFIAELSNEKKRTFSIGLVSSALPLGFISAGVISNLFADWHLAFLSGIVPVVISLLALFILPKPKSKRWNVYNNLNTNNVNDETAVISYKASSLKSIFIIGAILVAWPVFLFTPAWLEDSINSAVQLNSQRGLIMMVLATSGIGGSILITSVTKTIGLRKAIWLCISASFIILFMLLKLNAPVAVLNVIEMGIVAFFFGIGQGVLSFYLAAIFSKNTNSATAFCFNTPRLFTSASIFFTGASLAFFSGYGNVVSPFLCMFLTALAAIYFLKNRITIKVFDFNAALAD